MLDGISLFDDVSSIPEAHGRPPFVSLYLPLLGSSGPEHDRIVLKNLVRQARERLESRFGRQADPRILKHLDYLCTYRKEVAGGDCPGLAVFSSASATSVYRLSRPVEELCCVGPRYYLRPLLPFLAVDARYLLLALASDRFALVEGGRGGLERVALPADVASTFHELFPDDDGGGKPLSMRATGRSLPWYFGADPSAQGERDAEKFFRHVDEVMRERSQAEGPAPLILVGLAENQAEFRKIARIPGLLERGIDYPIEALGESELIERARALLDAERRRRLGALLDSYRAAQGRRAAAGDLDEIGAALAECRVRTLFFSEEARLQGRFDAEGGGVELSSEASADAPQDCEDDLIDALAQASLRQGGEVQVLPAADMPDGLPLAALLRF